MLAPKVSSPRCLDLWTVHRVDGVECSASPTSKDTNPAGWRFGHELSDTESVLDLGVKLVGHQFVVLVPAGLECRQECIIPARIYHVDTTALGSG